MEIIKGEKFNTLKARIGYQLKRIDDVYKPASIDENGNEVEEHIPYYFTVAYVPMILTIDEAMEIYEEEYRGDVD